MFNPFIEWYAYSSIPAPLCKDPLPMRCNDVLQNLRNLPVLSQKA